MKNWKGRMLLGLMIMAALLSGCAGGGEAGASGSGAEAPAGSGGGEVGGPVKIVFSITAGPDTAQGAAQKAFQETLERSSNGNVQVECYDSGTLYGKDTEFEALKSGEVDLIYCDAAQLSGGSPWAAMFSAGYLFQSYDHMTGVLNGGIGEQAFQAIADEQGVLPLGAFYLGSRHISLSEDRAVSTPSDLKGVSLCMPDSEEFLGRAMGCTPVPIAFSDLRLALETGTVSGQDNPLPDVWSAGLYQVQGSVSLTGHRIDSVWPVIRLETWNRMSAQQQAWVREAVEAARQACDQQSAAAEAEAREQLEAQGLPIYEIDTSAFSEQVLDAYQADAVSDSWDMGLFQQIREQAR